MNKIPTAEEFFENKLGEELSLRGCSGLLAKDLAIEFTKLHVQAAKQAYFEVIKSEGLVTEAGIAYLENAYNLDLIK
jgi:hypothetical protein